MAPAGGWIGVTGSIDPRMWLLVAIVVTWIGGFDLIYCCQDYGFDIEHGLHSVAQKWGIAASLTAARWAHAVTGLCLLATGLVFSLGWPYYLGWLIAVGLSSTSIGWCGRTTSRS